MSNLPAFQRLMLPAVEAEMRHVFAHLDKPPYTEMHHMLAYHLGWEGENAGPQAGGKRVRPLLLLLTTAACAQPWEKALPAAAAVELIPNFSLIHDDIQDESPLRRGRPTVWKRWGIAQAINAGDAMFTLGHLALLRLRETCDAAIALEANAVLQHACLQLTQGQFLDLAYEQRTDLTEADYWPMIRGKTAALLAACTELGALIGQTSPQRRAAFARFGERLGLAFQVLDDELGIWGDEAVTGKSVASDLLEGKNTLPVLYGLARGGPFAKRWQQGPLAPDEVPQMAQWLEDCGAREYTRQKAAELTAEALAALEEAQPQGPAGDALRELADSLLHRRA